MLWRFSGWSASLAEKAVQTSWRDDPKQKQFMIGLCKPVPSVSGDDDGSTSVEVLRNVVERDSSTAFQDVEGLFRIEMTMDRYAGAERHLLGPKREFLTASRGAGFDENTATVAEMHEV